MAPTIICLILLQNMISLYSKGKLVCVTILKTKNYRRFKVDNTVNRNHKASETIGFLDVFEKR